MKEDKNIGEKLVGHFSKADNRSTQIDQDIEEWRNSSSENNEKYNSYRKIWKGTEKLASARHFKPEPAWQKTNRKLTGITKTSNHIRRLRDTTIGMAASILLLLGFAFYFNWFSLSSGGVQIATANGSRSEMVLPDGTLVKLNVGSKLQYSFNKFSKTREVQFNGEAYFEVAKKHFPFVIHSNDGMQLKVLGTRFNYSNYDDDREIKTTLAEGKVELSNERGKSFIISPGQVASFDKKSKQIKLLKVNPSHSYGWLEDKLYMDNMSLDEVCSKLERRYDVEINCQPLGFAKNIHYTGVLREETVVTVLDALCELSAITYSMKGNKILIAKK